MVAVPDGVVAILVDGEDETAGTALATFMGTPRAGQVLDAENGTGLQAEEAQDRQDTHQFHPVLCFGACSTL